MNDQTAAVVRAYPEKLIGFMSVHPRDPGMLEEMERCTGQLGMRGIKLGPNYQNFDPLGEDAFRLYARAQELRLPIVFHQGTSPVRFADLDYAHPRHLDRVATRFPELRIVMAHMAHPWQMDCIAVIRKHPHVWADVSALHYRPWSYYTCLRLATEWSVLPKLLFGSDFPVATPQETMEAMPRINDILEGTKLPPVPVDELQRVLERDALGALGCPERRSGRRRPGRRPAPAGRFGRRQGHLEGGQPVLPVRSDRPPLQHGGDEGLDLRPVGFGEALREVGHVVVPGPAPGRSG